MKGGARRPSLQNFDDVLLVGIDTDIAGDFERALLSTLRAKNADVLNDIATQKALSDDLRARLKAAIDAFAATYA